MSNRLKELHEFVKATDSQKFQKVVDEICADLDISLSSYYRKMADPEKSFSNAEKRAIAAIFETPVHFIFTEYKSKPGA